MRAKFIPKVCASRRLSIRPLNRDDYETWVDSQEKTRPALDEFDTGPLPLEKRTEATFVKAVREQQRQAKKDSRYVWNIFLKRSGELIGFIDVKPISRVPHQLADIGYFITNYYRGNGYAKEALRKVIPMIFKDLELHRLEVVIDLDNKPSIRLAKSCGMYREGIRKHYWFQNGRWEDQMVFVATPELFK